MTDHDRIIGLRDIFKLWWPLAVTWLLLFGEGPILAAIVARYPEEKLNLAALGVGLSLLLLFESPILMMFSATISFVGGRESFRAMQRFCLVHGLFLSLFMLFSTITPFFFVLTQGLLGVSDELLPRVRELLLYSFPIPLIVGLRRFYQGVIVRSAAGRIVALGTALRIVVLVGTGSVLSICGVRPMQVVAFAWLFAITTDYAVARFGGRGSIADMERRPETTARAPTFFAIASFYYPLALSTLISISAQPILTGLISKSLFPLESLATIGIVSGFSNLFRAAGLAYQDATVAVLAKGWDNLAKAREFAFRLAAVLSVLFAVAAFSPFADFWLRTVSGLSDELIGFSRGAVCLFILHPALSVMYAFHRGLFMTGKQGTEVTIVSVIELGGIALVTLAGVLAGFSGLWAASFGSLFSLAAACGWMIARGRSMPVRS